jgi:hypothetical protein
MHDSMCHELPCLLQLTWRKAMIPRDTTLQLQGCRKQQQLQRQGEQLQAWRQQMLLQAWGLGQRQGRVQQERQEVQHGVDAKGAE